MGEIDKKEGFQKFVEQLRPELPRLQNQYSVRSLGLFGSYVRGEQNLESDLDILIEFKDVPGMFRFLELERELSELLEVRVDLVQKNALKPAIGLRIMSEVKQLL